MRLSIVTISYNQAQFLPKVLASIAAQLGPEDEHIVVDPGSSDDSRRLIMAHVAGEKRCRPLFEKDRGPADGLNKGCAIATGDVLAYVNADDWLLPGALDYVRDHFRKQVATDVLIGGIKMADEAGRVHWRGRVADLPTRARLVSGICQYYQQGTFFRRTLFLRTGGFNLGNRTCWDRELMVDLAIAGARFHTTSRPLGVFRVHSQSITGLGRNGTAYAADLARIQQKIAQAMGSALSPVLTQGLQLERRFNPLRLLRQLRPAS